MYRSLSSGYLPTKAYPKNSYKTSAVDRENKTPGIISRNGWIFGHTQYTKWRSVSPLSWRTNLGISVWEQLAMSMMTAAHVIFDIQNMSLRNHVGGGPGSIFSFPLVAQKASFFPMVVKDSSEVMKYIVMNSCVTTIPVRDLYCSSFQDTLRWSGEKDISIDDLFAEAEGLQFWKSMKQVFRQFWRDVSVDNLFEKIYLAIVHGSIELERMGPPYPEKKTILRKAIAALNECASCGKILSESDVLDLETDLIMAGFKMPEVRGKLVAIKAYFGFIDEIDDDDIARVILRIDAKEHNLEFPIEQIPFYLRYEGAGVCWVERRYEGEINIGRFEPGGEITSDF